MSLLLDALRKSEKRRQADTPPLSLPSGPGPYRRDPRGSRTWIVVGLIVAAIVLAVAAAAVAAWFYLWPIDADRADPLADTDTTEQQLVVPAYAAPDAGPRDGPGGADWPRGQDVESVRRPAETVRTRSEPMTGTDPEAAARSDSRQAGNDEDRDDGGDFARARPEPNASDPEDTKPPATETETETRAESRAPARPRPEDGPAPERPRARVQSPDAVGSGPPDDESGNANARPAEPGGGRNSILPWELPAGARADFPELDVSLHFYASEPDNRFVLIGGERFVEGDRVAAGVVLAEITREGVVVDYRNYRVRLR